MTPNEYQQLAARTECNQVKAGERLNHGGTLPVRLNHAVIGLAGEVGELAAAVERHVYYGQRLDETNIREELGDCLWYIALACNTLDTSIEYLMRSNIHKLKTRYPEKFTEDKAAEENRDREAERLALEAYQENATEAMARDLEYESLPSKQFKGDPASQVFGPRKDYSKTQPTCPKCGTPFSDRVPKYCPECGEDLR